MFTTREEAGYQLAQQLAAYKQQKDTLVLAIPRGGVLVGRAIADRLDLPLDVLVVKKLGAPANPELAIGAVSSNGVTVVDKELIATLGVSEAYLESEIAGKIQEVKSRESLLRSGKRKPPIKGRCLIVVDDGIATGATIEAAINYLRKHQPAKIILAVPVGPRDTMRKLKKLADEVVVLAEPENFSAVGEFYESFPQVGDEEVRELLESRITN